MKPKWFYLVSIFRCVKQIPNIFLVFLVNVFTFYLDVDQKRIVYSIKEWPELIDSSDMTIDEWIHIANDIRVSFEILKYLVSML